MYLNKVFLVGRLTADPVLRNTPSGQSVCNFGIATNRTWTNRETEQKEEETQYHNIVMWRKLAEIGAQFLSKGSLILIEGRLSTRSWEDPSSGKKLYKTEIIAERMQMGPRGVRETGPAPRTEETKPSFPKNESSSEKIPIIEENETLDNPTKEENNNEKDKENNNNKKESRSSEEIDVKDLPF